MHSGFRDQGKGFRIKRSAVIDFRHAILQPVQRLSGLLTLASKNGRKTRNIERIALPE
jgi:hypothetical protein